MVRLLRLALQVVLFFLLLSFVIAVASEETGLTEKFVLVAAGALLLWLTSRLRRLGASFHQAHVGTARRLPPSRPPATQRTFDSEAGPRSK